MDSIPPWSRPIGLWGYYLGWNLPLFTPDSQGLSRMRNSSTSRFPSWFGAAALASVAVGLSPAVAQQQDEQPGTPPPRDLIQPRTPNQDVPVWDAEPMGPNFLEASYTVHATPVIPDEGIGLPEGMVHPEREAPFHKRRIIGPIRRDANLETAGPVTDDESLNQGIQAQPLLQDFESQGPNGLTPPDPDAASGFDYVVTVTNDDFAVHDRCGNVLFTSDIHDYLGIDTSFLVFDPKVIFDPWDGRWVMMWHKRKTSTEEASLAFVVTAGSTPFGLAGSGVYWYDVNAVQNGGTSDASWPDYFDLGYSNDFVTCGGNMFRFAGGFRWARVWFLDKADLYTAGPLTTVRYSNLTNADGSTTTTPRAVKMQTSWTEGGLNIDGTFINSRGGGGDRLTHWKGTDILGANTLTRADIGTTAYASPPNAVQPSGASLDTIDCRLMTATTTTDLLGANGVELFTSLTTAFNSEARVHLFKLNPQNNTLEWETRFGGGTDWYYWFASSAADYSGSNFWVFARTGAVAGREPELRFVDYDQGAFSGSSSSIRAGSASYGGFRWGDYFGGGLDWGDYSANFSLPGRPAKVWMYGEFGKSGSGWGTHVGAASVFSGGDLTSVTPSSAYNISGPVGGPFSPSSRNYSLTNGGGLGIVYEVVSLPSWLSVSSAQGQLFPGSANVTLSVNSNANSLPPGNYSDTVVFRDCFNGGNSFNRTVNLTVELFSSYCAVNNNSTGLPAIMGATGSGSTSAGDLVVSASTTPNQFGIFFHGANQNQIPFGCGFLCATGSIRRGDPVSGGGGSASYAYDNSSSKRNLGAFVGNDRNFQFWYRDPMHSGVCGNTFNYSNAITIGIVP